MLTAYEKKEGFDARKVDLVPSKQWTLKNVVSAKGVGLFSGEEVALTLCPAEPGQGVVFCREDLPCHPSFLASFEHVQGTPRCTIVGEGKASVQTVEHLLAALRAYQVDNVLIKLSGGEVPIFDGSSRFFVEMIESAGIREQEEEKGVLRLKEPLYWSKGSVHLIALPSEEYRVSYTLHYPQCPVIGTQFFTLPVTAQSFKEEIASSRTFSVYEEIAPMIEKGLIRGGSLDNAVLVQKGQIVNSEGLRYDNEMVRHKVLDLIGDLSLLPPFLAHIVAICSGHASNNAFAKHFSNHIKMESL